MTTPTLVFVYAVDGGLVNALVDSLHKIVSPATYACSLCALTYSPIGMRSAWSDAIRSLGIPSEFLHRDEFVARFGPSETPLPAVLVARDGELRILASRDEIDGCSDLDHLIALVRQRTLEVPDGSPGARTTPSSSW